MQDDEMKKSARELQARAGDFLADQARFSSRAQAQFLESRQETLRQIGSLVRMQAELERAPGMVPSNRAAPLVERALLEEFAAGSVERGLGPEYAVFRGRRLPRIPNGDLLMMDRVMEIQGTRGQLDRPSEIRTEYDVPADAWFFQAGETPVVPYSILMEMALQPCGYLSAYLGTMLIHSNSNLYFRNLDGEAVLHHPVDLRGRTVSGWARMLSHTVNEETIIQKFAFRLETGGQVFFSGQSVFGFFPEESMLRQVGLDGGKESLPQYLQPESTGLTGQIYSPANLSHPSGLKLASGKLELLDELYIQPEGGKYGLGYLFAKRAIHPEDWYFSNHFFQDPVMPGSLGVEAILEAMRGFAIARNLADGYDTAHFELVEGLACQWKYRGQILSGAGEMRLEAHISRIEPESGGVLVVADASLWTGKMRIYQLKNGAIRIAKGFLS